MKLQMKIAMVLGALALAVTPAMALASQPTNPGQGDGQSNGPKYTPEGPKTPGPGASLPEKAKAYGVYCKDQSKKHVKGEKGTPFSQCVTAMAKAANNEKLTPSKACKGMSKKHVKGEKGTPFSQCVKAAAKLRKDQQS
ncbi:MAG TPA: hypothetical protein VIE64_03795 [Solirubrobacterales bacterium]|jgi:hypothetical protein